MIRIHPLPYLFFVAAILHTSLPICPQDPPVARFEGPVPDEVPAGLSAADWLGIRQAYEAKRHAAYPFESGYRAQNPGQEWQTIFDGRGFTTTPDDGTWTWGLELKSYGFADKECEAKRPACVSAKGQRVVYLWDETVEEWYVNDLRGLEHGYTFHKRPFHGKGSAERGPLILTLTIRGDLAPQVAGDGRSVRFLRDANAALVLYSGLTVYDADGRTLPARFECAAGELRVTVYEQGAPYPLTVDPIAQQAYLKASNTDENDRFGAGVAVSGDTVVVGAWLEDSKATGVNGDQSDNSAGGAGAAYVFLRNGTTWSQQAYLKASNTDPDDLFGHAVAISGDTIVVGAYGEESGATGVNGNQSDNNAPYSGAAYVFVRTGTTWSQQAYLKASNTDPQDQFGVWVTIDGDTVVVGANFESSSATGVNGDQSNNNAHNAGAAYVFVRNGPSWSQQAYVKASNTDADDRFGLPLALSGDTLVAGAWSEDSGAIGVNGIQGNATSGFASGAAYVFQRSGASWTQEAYLKASNTDPGDQFGWSVAVSNDTVIVGARSEDSNATGVNGNQSDNSSIDSGAAYVFVRGATGWSQQAYLKASNTGQGDLFGNPVVISNDTVVVGAASEDSNATGVNGNQNDDSAVRAGAAYVFTRSCAIWRQAAYVKSSNTEAFDVFGSSLGISADTVVIGAELEDSNATGVNGNQSDNGADAAGAAYVFQLTPGPLASCEFRNGSGVNPPDFCCATNPVIGTNWESTISLTPTIGSTTTATVIMIGSGTGPISGVFVLGGQELLILPATFDIAVGTNLGTHSIPVPNMQGPVFTQGLRIELTQRLLVKYVLLNALDLYIGI